jgi:hypothetical protein
MEQQKTDSRILRIDTVESVEWPGETQQSLSFLICGFGHSDSPGTKIDTATFSKKGSEDNPVGSLDLWIDLIPYSPGPPQSR